MHTIELPVQPRQNLFHIKLRQHKIDDVNYCVDREFRKTRQFIYCKTRLCDFYIRDKQYKKIHIIYV